MPLIAKITLGMVGLLLRLSQVGLEVGTRTVIDVLINRTGRVGL